MPTVATSAARPDCPRRELEALVERAWARRGLEPLNAEAIDAVQAVMAELNEGRLRAAQRATDGTWQTRSWVLHALVLSFCVSAPRVVRAGDLTFYDQAADRFQGVAGHEWAAQRCRVQPGAFVRWGTYLGKGVHLLPSYVGAGAYIDDGTLVDGCANVGSGAQIGKRVHISAGVVLGGVLEPLQERPVIIEDNCFIGANACIVEGVLVEQGSVIAMGVHLGQGTRIFDRESGRVLRGRVPAGSVVIPGAMPSECGRYSMSCAVIVKQVDDVSRAKTALTDLVRL